MPNCAEKTAPVADPRWELNLLSSARAFYLRILSEHLGDKILLAPEMASSRVNQADDLHAAIRHADLWIQLLDMAITPAMLRLGLNSGVDTEVAEALLRHFARHQSHSPSGRDKADLIATFLFRHPRVPGQWGQRGYALDGALPSSPFEIALQEIRAQPETPLPDSHLQALQEFGPLLAQAHRFQDFSALIDSGILTRVRELKTSLGQSMYSSMALAIVAPYNAAFGPRFHALLTGAVQQIKNLARTIAQNGGSVLAMVEGVEISADQAMAVDAEKLLELDYPYALEKFRRIAQLRKKLAGNPPVARARAAIATAAASSSPVAERAATAFVSESRFVPSAITPEALSVEETKLSRVAESIRVFVRAADPKSRRVVPMRYFNLMLNDAQAEVCASHYSYRAGPDGDAAQLLLRMLAMNTRIATEMEELKRSLYGSSVWRMHAESLAVLLHIARTTPEDLAHLTVPEFWTAAEKANSLHASLENLRARAAEAEKALAGR
ncbi:MAG: hypothetical protein WBS24_09975 [Terriglobales bacterium]